MYETSGRETHNQALKRKFHHLEKQQHTYKSVFEAIQTRSDQEALEIVRRIRSGDDLGNIVEQMANGDLLLQLSLIPETRYRYEFPFKAKMPAILNSPGNRYLNSPLYDLAPSDAPRPRLTNVTTGSPSETYGPYLKPFHAAEFVDALLSSAEPSKWTTVSSNDNLLRKLLGLYFRQEHLFLAFVHKDYFLEDMNNGHERFCSSLLVNAMLAYACVRNTFFLFHCSWLFTDTLCRSPFEDSRIAPSSGTQTTLDTDSWRKPKDFGRRAQISAN